MLFSDNKSVHPSGGSANIFLRLEDPASSVIDTDDDTNASTRFSIVGGSTIFARMSGTGAPAGGLCTTAMGGSIYNRTDGTTTTSLYVCDGSTGTWTAK